jgi:hypothetical protein
MDRSTIVSDGVSYLVNFDEPRARGDIYQAIVMAQLIDEITGEPLNVPVTVSTPLARVRTKVAQNGVVGVVGVPSWAFSALSGPTVDFEVSFDAPGYMTFTTTVSQAILPTFPTDFDSTDLGQLLMRRGPVSLSGTAVQLNAQNQAVPVGAAEVSISGIWRRLEDVDLSAPADAPNLLSISPSLYAERPQPGSDLEIVTLAPVAEPDRRLLKSTGPGDIELSVDQHFGVAAGSVVAIDIDDPDRIEHIEVQQVIGPSDTNSPATLRLRFPVKHRHRATVRVQRVNVPAIGAPDATLTDIGMPGDVTLFVDTTAAFGPSQTVRVRGGTSVSEYVECRPYLAVSDADGHYRLPRLARLAAVEVTAARAAPPPALNAVEPVSLNYNLFENRHDLTLS